MREFERKVIPSCLSNKYSNTSKTFQQDRTERWLKRVKKHKIEEIKSISFNWYKLDKSLVPLLKEMTQGHCAFCDRKFSEDDSVEIEHFIPKINFPESAFEWENLFPICRKCNSKKGEKHNEGLLKPDSKNYKFHKHFSFENIKTCKIIPKSTEAEITKKIYDLNRSTLLKARKKELEEIEERIADKRKISQLESKQKIINNFFNYEPKNDSDKEIICKFLTNKIDDYSYRNFIEFCYPLD